jgi:hypothetical protein
VFFDDTMAEGSAAYSPTPLLLTMGQADVACRALAPSLVAERSAEAVTALERAWARERRQAVARAMRELPPPGTDVVDGAQRIGVREVLCGASAQAIRSEVASSFDPGGCLVVVQVEDEGRVHEQAASFSRESTRRPEPAQDERLPNPRATRTRRRETTAGPTSTSATTGGTGARTDASSMDTSPLAAVAHALRASSSPLGGRSVEPAATAMREHRFIRIAALAFAFRGDACSLAPPK